jgi:thymidine kinase
MFLEPIELSTSSGWMEVICGSMFSGKTEELMRRLRRAQFAGQSIMIFKPAMDTRYQPEAIVSHDKRAIPSTPVTVAQQILLLSQEMQVVGVDEAQFFDEGIVDVCNELANHGKRVIIAGLDMDYAGKPFGCMPQLMATAEFVTKLHAVCTRTGRMAHYSYRKSESDATIFLGEKDLYEPLSRMAYNQALHDEAARHPHNAARPNMAAPTQ